MLVKRQGAKGKLRQLVGPLLTKCKDSQSLAFQAFGTIRPRISLRSTNSLDPISVSKSLCHLIASSLVLKRHTLCSMIL